MKQKTWKVLDLGHLKKKREQGSLPTITQLFIT
jgi:hypothetical protein